MKTIPASEVKKLLRAQFPSLKKPWFGLDPIRLFDMSYCIPSFGWVNAAVENAMHNIEKRGLIPSRDYIANSADCENWALWIQAEVTMEWALNGEKGHAVTFGFDTDKGHALNIAITDSGIKFWNYGVYSELWSGEILEVEFK